VITRSTRDRFTLPSNTFQSKLFWDIMTALRGPDQFDYNGDQGDTSCEVKERTTTVIRAVVTPWAERSTIACNVALPTTCFEVRAADIGAVGDHFIRHVIAAASALGLITTLEHNQFLIDLYEDKDAVLIGRCAEQVLAEWEAADIEEFGASAT
jgi:hypothetical protein